MSTQGPPADAKQAQAAALQEIEAAQRRKRALDMNLVSAQPNSFGVLWVAKKTTRRASASVAQRTRVFTESHRARAHALCVMLCVC